MKISAKKILELNSKHNLIQGLSERELNNPEGAGFDLRVGEIYKFKDGEEGFLGVTERKSPDIEKVADIKTDGNKKFTLKPGDYVLVKTMETVNVPSEKVEVETNREARHLMLDAYPRSTLQRCGIYFRSTKTDPGYSGNLTFALVNLGKSDFTIELGARFANVVFSEVIGDLARSYSGQWNQGRVSTEGKSEVMN